MTTGIVRHATPEEEELQRKLQELDALMGEVAEGEEELATLLVELHAFEQRYLRIVGRRYAELDRIEAEIAAILARLSPADTAAQQEAAEASARADESAEAAGAAPAEPSPRERFVPPEGLKRLFREVAKRVHPDLTTNEQERVRRQRFMADANAAYEAGDQARLEAILREWEASPEAVEGGGVGAELVRAIRQIAQARARLKAIGAEMARLRESDLHELRAKAEAGEAEGRDVLAEMAMSLDEQIASARLRLEALERKEASAR